MNKKKFRKPAIAVGTAAAILASAATCYAADIGGIQRAVQVWFHGDQTNAVMTVSENDGIAQYSIQDSSGNVLQQGGGVAENNDGSYRPLTSSEIQEDLDGPTTDTVDGRRYLYYKDQKMDISDKFDDDGLCYVTLQDGSKKIYVTITKNGGMSASEERYTQKAELPEQWFEDD